MILAFSISHSPHSIWSSFPSMKLLLQALTAGYDPFTWIKAGHCYSYLRTPTLCIHSYLTGAFLQLHKVEVSNSSTHIKRRTSNSALPTGEAPAPLCTQKTMGKRDRNPLTAASGSIAWLVLGVCCPQKVNEDDLAFSPSHSLTCRICQLLTTCSYIQIIQSRLLCPSAAAVSGIVVEGEGGSLILLAHELSLRFFSHWRDEQSRQLPAFKSALQKAQWLQDRPECHAKILSNQHDSRDL